MLETSDALLDQGTRDLVAACLAYLRWHDEGEAYYRVSLAPAAVWGNVGGGGSVPDRRYSVAVTEADLHRAMMALPPMLFAVARLSRTDRGVGPGWTRRWDTTLGHCAGSDWLTYRDARLAGWDTKTRGVRVAQIIRGLTYSAAESMAAYLGPNWLR